MITLIKRSVISLFACLALLVSIAATAAPWVDTSDIYLRADIQALADAGVITVPVNTYPLMWSGIGNDLRKVEASTLTPALADAYARVNYYYRNALDNRGNASVKVAGGSDAARFQHFGSDYREQAQATASYEHVGDWFAYKVSATGAYDPDDNQSLRLDDSYLAAVWGNWIFSAGTQEQWWGPSFDSSLHKSNNARPMPTISLTRNNSHGFESPWLSWIGPWTATAGVSVMEKERFAPHALVWNMRGTVRPFKQLEIGVSWTTQLCGEGQECSAKQFVKSITGQADCSNDTGAGCTKQGNQMAGYDIRYSDTFFNIPVGLYVEKTCEDSGGKYFFDIVDCAHLFGADTRFSVDSQQYKLFFEYTDTMVACGEDDNVFNCFYEHSTYQSGSRYYGRSLGSTYDSDANVYVLGLIGQLKDSAGFTSLLRYAQLNKDGSNRGGVWSPKPAKEDLLMLEFSYRHPLWRGMATLGGTVSKSEFAETDTENKDGSDASIFGSYEYRF